MRNSIVSFFLFFGFIAGICCLGNPLYSEHLRAYISGSQLPWILVMLRQIELLRCVASL